MVIPVCNLLIYVLGPIALTQPPWVAIGVTVATVLVIGTRERMHSFARLIPQDEVLTAGKFLILVGIILPLIPDTRLIATAPVTPYHIWLAVIAISGLSYLTYLVQRYRPIKGGALLPALLGGAYSSTATTVVLAKQQRGARTRRPELSAGIIAATAIMYPRLTVPNGTVKPPAGLDWICVSPKAGAALQLTRGDELKVVVPQDGLDPIRFEDLPFEHFSIQPMDGPERERNTVTRSSSASPDQNGGSASRHTK
jgi:uncharacterized membrane protein (DUF4010 family)